MDYTEQTASEPESVRGSIICGGKILSKNRGICVESDYHGKKLHLGSGNCYWNGWINIDIDSEKADINCDLKKLDIEDNSADVAVAIHVLEHLYFWEAKDILIEWKRVLKPGGELILELPCMNKVFNYIRHALNSNQPLMSWCSWNALWGDPVYKSIPMTHKWGYTKEMAKELLESAGFKDIRFEEPNYHFTIRDMRIVAIK